MKRISLICAAAILGSGLAASANPIVSLGNYSIPVGSTQAISINVTDSGNAASEDIEGMTFTIQIAAGTGTAPSIDSVDMLTGTIWQGHVSIANDITPSGGNHPQFMVRSLITDNAGDFVNANGLLSTLVLDATGATPGKYTLSLVGTKDPGSDSSFLDGSGDTVPAQFAAGSLTVTAIPEPTATAILALGGLLLSRRPSKVG